VHLHRARLFAIFERMTTTRVGLSLAHPNQNPATSYSKVHPPSNSILFAKPRERVRAFREGLISSIWTRHPPTSWTIRHFLTSSGSSSTRSTTTMQSRWTPRSECASNSHRDPFCKRYTRCCGSVAAREAGAERSEARRRGSL
jgi:hypothetical protein